MKKILLFLAVFSFGYMCNDLAEKMNLELVKPAYAHVGSYKEVKILLNNLTFRNTVK
jgi:hypothetical protein